jgi:hypothetical protein
MTTWTLIITFVWALTTPPPQMQIRGFVSEGECELFARERFAIMLPLGSMTSLNLQRPMYRCSPGDLGTPDPPHPPSMDKPMP